MTSLNQLGFQNHGQQFTHTKKNPKPKENGQTALPPPQTRGFVPEI